MGILFAAVKLNQIVSEIYRDVGVEMLQHLFIT